MKYLRAIITSAAAVSAAVIGLSLVPASAAQAAQAAKPKGPPNPCKTFTTKEADALFGASKKAHIGTSITKYGKGATEDLICTVTYRKLRLSISTSEAAGGYGGPLKCYNRPKLGAHGQVCVSTNKNFVVTFAHFSKDSVYFFDDYNKILGHKGAALYTFALAQYKAYKG
jgi:hypothetical protein